MIELHLLEQLLALERHGTLSAASSALHLSQPALSMAVGKVERALGAPLQGAAVALRWSTEGVWLPASAELTGPYHAALARAIEAELGIPRSAQVWRTDESP